MTDQVAVPKKNTLSSMIEGLKAKPSFKRQLYTNAVSTWIPNFKQHMVAVDVMFDTLLVDLSKSKIFLTLLTNLELKLYHALITHYWILKQMDTAVHTTREQIDFIS